MSAATDGAMVRFDADSRAATVAKASPAVKLGESDERPDYNVIAEVLLANKIEPKIFRDVGRGKPLVQGAIKTFYEDVIAQKE